MGARRTYSMYTHMCAVTCTLTAPHITMLSMYASLGAEMLCTDNRQCNTIIVCVCVSVCVCVCVCVCECVYA